MPLIEIALSQEDSAVYEAYCRKIGAAAFAGDCPQVVLSALSEPERFAFVVFDNPLGFRDMTDGVVLGDGGGTISYRGDDGVTYVNRTEMVSVAVGFALARQYPLMTVFLKPSSCGSEIF